MIFNHSGSQALRWIKLVKKGTGQKWVNKAYLNATTKVFESSVNTTLFYLIFRPKRRNWTIFAKNIVKIHWHGHQLPVWGKKTNHRNSKKVKKESKKKINISTNPQCIKITQMSHLNFRFLFSKIWIFAQKNQFLASLAML